MNSPQTTSFLFGGPRRAPGAERVESGGLVGVSIDVRSGDVLAPIKADISVSLVVGHYDDEIRMIMISTGDCAQSNSGTEG